jgi:hypothetical protein
MDYTAERLIPEVKSESESEDAGSGELREQSASRGNNCQPVVFGEG